MTKPLAAFHEATCSGEALSFLFSQAKEKEPSFSLATLCERASIPSRGYLSGVINSRRPLHRKYRPAIAKAFGLRGTAAQFLLTLMALEDAVDSTNQAKLERRLARLRKALDIKSLPFVTEIERENLSFVAEVYCAFGLFKNSPTEEDLIDYFGRRHETAVISALDALMQQHLVQLDGLRYILNETHVMFGAPNDSNGLMRFIQSEFKTASRAVPTWFNRREHAHFESAIISVRMSQFRQLLPLIKDVLARSRSQMESGDADSLVRFCCGIYPIRDGGVQ